MFEILFAAVVCGLGLRTVQGSFVTQGGRLALPQVDLGTVRIWILLSLAVILVFKLKYGSALVLALLIHELGHVAGYRIIGHADARFRLAPLFTSGLMSTRATRSQAQEFFVTIMGAGFSLIPMVAALMLARLLETPAPDLATIFFAIGSTIAALNFVNLLPLLPLDGGRCLRQIFISLCPTTGTYILLVCSAGAAALSFVQESLFLIIIVCIGGLVFFRPVEDGQARMPMSQGTAALALAIYGFTLAAHAVSGWWLIRWYFW
ncbi:MAG: hypothetical protein ACNA7O_17945 [Rhodobacterales bacterium]